MVGKKAGESTGLHRRHLRPARAHQVKARFSDVEMAAIVGRREGGFDANVVHGERRCA